MYQHINGKLIFHSGKPASCSHKLFYGSLLLDEARLITRLTYRYHLQCIFGFRYMHINVSRTSNFLGNFVCQ